jgi:hypothetical protein
VAAADKNKQVELLDILWHMISKGYVQCDFNKRLNMNSEIWIKTQ